jgi:PmbA protein
VYGEPAIRELAERALRASQAEQTEFVFSGAERQLTRFANNTIHQHVAEQGAQVWVRVALGKKIGVAAGNRLDDAGLGELVERATAIARLQPDNEDFTSLPQPTPWERVAAYHEATAGATPEQRAEGVAAIVEPARARGWRAFGAFSTQSTELAVVNSLGVSAYHPMTTADVHAVIMSDEGSGYASSLAGDVSAIDPAAVGAAAVDRCARNRAPAELPPGEYEVLLEPPAVADLLGFLGWTAFNGLAVTEGRSFMAGKLGQQLLGANVSVWDDGHDRRGLPLPFDFEGVAKRRVVFFDRGVAREAVYDSATAAKAGRLSTGHALPPPNTRGAVPLNLVMANGDAPSRESMVRPIRRGVWVTRLWYTNLLHPMSMTLTGMTRDGTFLIENGEVAGALKNLRFTHSMVAALGDVRGISTDLSLQRSGGGSALVPALHLGAFTFTGATS